MADELYRTVLKLSRSDAALTRVITTSLRPATHTEMRELNQVLRAAVAEGQDEGGHMKQHMQAAIVACSTALGRPIWLLEWYLALYEVRCTLLRGVRPAQWSEERLVHDHLIRHIQTDIELSPQILSTIGLEV